jgi:hypothetical protein
MAPVDLLFASSGACACEQKVCQVRTTHQQQAHPPAQDYQDRADKSGKGLRHFSAIGKSVFEGMWHFFWENPDLPESREL